MDGPEVLGVVGAGVMGAGIAQLGGLAGMKTLVFDCSEKALTEAMSKLACDLDRGVERGRWSFQQAATAKDLVQPVGGFAELMPADLVIEAVPEDLEAK